MLDGMTTYKHLDTFNDLNSKYEGNQMCQSLSHADFSVNPLRTHNVTFEKCSNVSNGILINGGLTETLYHMLRNI